MKSVTNIFIALTAFMLLLGCYTQQKAQRQINHAQAKYPVLAAQKCDSLFPVIITKRDTFTNYLPGKETLRYDTTYLRGLDSVITREITITKAIHDTVMNTVRMRIADSAKQFIAVKQEDSLRRVIDKKEASLSGTKHSLILSGAGALVFFIGCVYFALKKKTISRSNV
jgi:hypothetical protein